MDMMFNTEMIVKDMKGGKEDMTEKRFKLRLSKLGNGMITDTQKREDLYFDKEFLDATLPKTNEWLNDLADKNEQLKSENKRLTDKLNETALEFLNHDMVTMGKATEISEMCYYDFLKFRKLKGDVE